MSFSLLPVIFFLTGVIIFSEAWTLITSHVLLSIMIAIGIAIVSVPTYRLVYVQVRRRRIYPPPPPYPPRG